MTIYINHAFIVTVIHYATVVGEHLKLQISAELLVAPACFNPALTQFS